MTDMPVGERKQLAPPVDDSGPWGWALNRFTVACYVWFRYDWPILAGIYLGSALVNGFWGLETGWKLFIRNMLPPLHQLSPNDLVNLGTVDTKAVVWLLGYSAICFVVAPWPATRASVRTRA